VNRHDHASGGPDESGERTNEPTPVRTGRRRFLGKAGVAGLAAAAAVFGRSTPAFAANYGCCNLLFAPSHSVAQCRTGSNYTWTCSMNAYLWCYCCEHKNSYGNYIYSSYSCQYG
jgi:hypothetical protein